LRESKIKEWLDKMEMVGWSSREKDGKGGREWRNGRERKKERVSGLCPQRISL